MEKLPPPLLGFNNNVRYRGRTFHIQTEDSGIKYARVMTHLFADGGRIVKSAKVDYSNHIGEPQMTDYVRRLMKEQHRAMFELLRTGAMDALIEGVFGESSGASVQPISTSEGQPRRRDSLPELSLPNSFSPPTTRPSKTPNSSKEAEVHGVTPGGEAKVPSRPSATFGASQQRPGHSIFGDTSVSEQSLDEVILSYLKDDLDDHSGEH